MKSHYVPTWQNQSVLTLKFQNYDRHCNDEIFYCVQISYGFRWFSQRGVRAARRAGGNGAQSRPRGAPTTLLPARLPPMPLPRTCVRRHNLLPYHLQLRIYNLNPTYRILAPNAPFSMKVHIFCVLKLLLLMQLHDTSIIILKCTT